MARPMVLVHEKLLEEIHAKHSQGVPVLKLIRHYELEGEITAPTLTKLLSYMTIKETAEEKVKSIIHKSLFPNWLSNMSPATSPPSYYYAGKMPLGTWIHNNGSIV